MVRRDLDVVRQKQTIPDKRYVIVRTIVRSYSIRRRRSGIRKLRSRVLADSAIGRYAIRIDGAYRFLFPRRPLNMFMPLHVLCLCRNNAICIYPTSVLRFASRARRVDSYRRIDFGICAI